MKPHLNVQMIKTVATGLGPLKEKVVFVGGAVTSLYVDDPSAPPVTASDDVDCVIEISGQVEYARLEKQLRKLGFKTPIDPEDREVICRWDYRGIRVDVMPSDEKILGFSNRWYPEAMKNRISKPLPGGVSVFIFSLPYFIATKLEALKGRGGGGDIRFSQDLEDIVAVMDGCQQMESLLQSAPSALRQYFKKEFGDLLKQRDFFLEAIEGFLRSPMVSPTRAGRVLRIFEEFCKKA